MHCFLRVAYKWGEDKDTKWDTVYLDGVDSTIVLLCYHAPEGTTKLWRTARPARTRLSTRTSHLYSEVGRPAAGRFSPVSEALKAIASTELCSHATKSCTSARASNLRNFGLPRALRSGHSSVQESTPRTSAHALRPQHFAPLCGACGQTCFWVRFAVSAAVKQWSCRANQPK